MHQRYPFRRVPDTGRTPAITWSDAPRRPAITGRDDPPDGVVAPGVRALATTNAPTTSTPSARSAAAQAASVAPVVTTSSTRRATEPAGTRARSSGGAERLRARSRAEEPR